MGRSFGTGDDVDIVLGLITAFVVLLGCVLQGVELWWPLGGAIVLLLLIHLRRGQPLSQLLRYCWQGAKQSWPVFSILLNLIHLETWSFNKG